MILCFFMRWASTSTEACDSPGEQSGFGSNLGHTTLGPRAYEGFPIFGLSCINYEPLWQEFIAESSATIWKPSQGPCCFPFVAMVLPEIFCSCCDFAISMFYYVCLVSSCFQSSPSKDKKHVTIGMVGYPNVGHWVKWENDDHEDSAAITSWRLVAKSHRWYAYMPELQALKLHWFPEFPITSQELRKR